MKPLDESLMRELYNEGIRNYFLKTLVQSNDTELGISQYCGQNGESGPTYEVFWPRKLNPNIIRDLTSL